MTPRNQYNPERPLIMHIDLNSCFATVEQQARPMLRHRPVAIANRRTENTSIVAASYEAKALGITLGMKVYEAKKLAPDLVVLESDPPKYRYVYHKLMDIMKRYSAHITMKSIDEGIIDFHQTTADVTARDLVDIGYEIKQALLSEVGCWMHCNVGIAPNRFLAKTAAGLHENLREVRGTLKLTDLTGIAGRNEARLNKVGIYTPLQFLDADPVTLKKIVFKSVNGIYWHQRLRGWEVDDVNYGIKTVGRQYVLERRDLSRTDMLKRLHHLCESVGHRLRSQGKAARGVIVSGRSKTHGYWHHRRMAALPFFSNQAIYAQAAMLFAQAPEDVTMIAISCYQLEDSLDDQLSLFGDQLAREQHVTEAVDEINRRFGDRSIHAADTLGTGIYVKQKVPFGSTRYI